MQLANLIAGLDVVPYGADMVEVMRRIGHVTKVTADSNDVVPGALFVAVAGGQHNGSDYIQEAVASGAKIIVAAPEILRQGKWFTDGVVGFFSAVNPRRVLAQLAGRFYVPVPETLVGVTGTNGKSSVTSFVRQIWTHAGFKAACIGTLGLDAPDVDAFPHPPCQLTTPTPVILHKYLHALAEYNVTHVSLEVSSHGLHQHRVDGLSFKAAGFTSFSQDHLDYHASMDEYFEAKARLFSELLSADGVAVLNADIPQYASLKKICDERKIKVIDYGKSAHALRLVSQSATANGQRIVVDFQGKSVDVTLPLFGTFQVHNAMCAAGLALATGVAQDKIVEAWQKLEAVVGRLQFVAQTTNGARIYVDYAHTPDALDVVLTSMRPHTQGKLIVVFGCGGDRDKAKRPIMGEIASRLADKIIVTDDNPRSENPGRVRQSILEGCVSGADVVEIGDRSEAIAYACASADSDDVVIVAGKGHEQGQIIGHTVLPFDDAQVARRVIQNMQKGRKANGE